MNDGRNDEVALLFVTFNSIYSMSKRVSESWGINVMPSVVIWVSGISVPMTSWMLDWTSLVMKTPVDTAERVKFTVALEYGDVLT